MLTHEPGVIASRARLAAERGARARLHRDAGRDGRRPRRRRPAVRRGGGARRMLPRRCSPTAATSRFTASGDDRARRAPAALGCGARAAPPEPAAPGRSCRQRRSARATERSSSVSRWSASGACCPRLPPSPSSLPKRRYPLLGAPAHERAAGRGRPLPPRRRALVLRRRGRQRPRCRDPRRPRAAALRSSVGRLVAGRRVRRARAGAVAEDRDLAGRRRGRARSPWRRTRSPGRERPAAEPVAEGAGGRPHAGGSRP